MESIFRKKKKEITKLWGEGEGVILIQRACYCGLAAWPRNTLYIEQNSIDTLAESQRTLNSKTTTETDFSQTF